MGQRCADPKILRPHQSADSDHRSTTASAGRCYVGSAVSPRVRNSLSDVHLSGYSLSLNLSLHPIDSHARVRDSPSGPPAPASIYRPRLHLHSTSTIYSAPHPLSPQPYVHCPIYLSVAGSLTHCSTINSFNCCGCRAWSRGRDVTGIERRARPSSLGTIASADSAHWARRVS